MTRHDPAAQRNPFHEEDQRHEQMVAEAAVTLPSGVVELWRVCQAARDAHNASGIDWPIDPAYARYSAAAHAIRDARPTDPTELAAQLRYLIAECEIHESYLPTILHVADRLEALAEARS